MNVKSILKQLPTGWAEEAEAMGEEQLRNVIVEASNNIRTARSDMEENAGFQEAKDAYKLAAEPFRDAIKAQQAKVSYALLLLESKGKI
jgi:hypothetical protein